MGAHDFDKEKKNLIANFGYKFTTRKKRYDNSTLAMCV